MVGVIVTPPPTLLRLPGTGDPQATDQRRARPGFERTGVLTSLAQLHLALRPQSYVPPLEFINCYHHHYYYLKIRAIGKLASSGSAFAQASKRRIDICPSCDFGKPPPQ